MGSPSIADDVVAVPYGKQRLAGWQKKPMPAMEERLALVTCRIRGMLELFLGLRAHRIASADSMHRIPPVDQDRAWRCCLDSHRLVLSEGSNGLD